MKRRRAIQSEGRAPVIMVHELGGSFAAIDGCLQVCRPSAAMVEPVHGTANLVVASRRPRCFGEGCNNWAVEEGGRVRGRGGWDGKKDQMRLHEGSLMRRLSGSQPRTKVPNSERVARCRFCLAGWTSPFFFWLPQAKAKTGLLTAIPKSCDGSQG